MVVDNVEDNQNESYHASSSTVLVCTFLLKIYPDGVQVLVPISETSSQPATTKAPALPTTKKIVTTTKLPSRVCAISDENILASLDRRKECTFPFMYGGVLHSQCITLDSRRPWCPTKIDANHHFPRDEWGYCVPCWT